jgi:hypothetical protein
MISVPCNNYTHKVRVSKDTSHMIDVEVTTIELVETTGFGLLCQSCQIEAKTNQRNKKLNKVLRKTPLSIIKEWLVNIVNSVKS